MRDELIGVIALQREFTHLNTPAMQRRGRLIRDAIPRQLLRITDELQTAMAPFGEDLRFKGRDGLGRKTLIPWVRYFSLARSPNAQTGWYCVYLFDTYARGVYLALAHGSTDYEDGDFKPKPRERVAELVSWARDVLRPEIAADPQLAVPMDLGGQVLGDAYERSTALAKYYAAGAMPADEDLYADAVRFARLLRSVYEAEELGRAPGATPPEVAEVVSAARGRAVPRRAGQGFGLSAPQRQAVERRAMELVGEHLQDQGWDVTDVSSDESFDFKCTRGDEELFVEVKGTTSLGEQVVLTRNEVNLHRQQFPNNALAVVSLIDLRLEAGAWVATGGDLRLISPWEIEEEALRPLTFRYAVPDEAIEDDEE